MRILDGVTGEDLENPDLENGYLTESLCIKKDAVPIDNVEKFAWDDDDYEPCYCYFLNSDLLQGQSPMETEMSDINNVLISMYEVVSNQEKTIAEQDDAICALYESMIGGM